MEDIQKNELMSFLKKTISLLELEKKNTENQINQEQDKIDKTNELIVNVTKEIINIETEKRELDLSLGRTKSEKAELEENHRIIKGELDDNNKHLSQIQLALDLKKKLYESVASWNPLAPLILEAILILNGSYENIKRNTFLLQSRNEDLKLALSKNYEKEKEVALQLSRLETRKKKLISDQIEADEKTKGLGKELTKFKNLSLDFVQFVNRCNSILDIVNKNVKVSDDLYASKEDLKKSIGLMYKNYNREIPSDILELIKDSSSTSSKSPDVVFAAPPTFFIKSSL